MDAICHVRYYVLYVSDGIMITKRDYTSKTHLVAEVPDCLTYYGPWSESRVIDFLADAHPELWPEAEVQIAVLRSTGAEYCRLTFAPMTRA